MLSKYNWQIASNKLYILHVFKLGPILILWIYISSSEANKPSLEVFDDAVPTPKTGLKTALVKESECVGLKDWLVDDVSTPAEEDLENGNDALISWDWSWIDDRIFYLKDRLKMRRPVDSLPSSSKRASKRTSSSSSDDDRGTSKPLTKICKTIESSHSQDSKILQSNFNNEQRPFAEVEVSPREPASIKKWVNVTVGDKSIGVPFVERWICWWLHFHSQVLHWNILLFYWSIIFLLL